MTAPVDRAPTALERLIAEPKGVVSYKAGDAFLLHVLWQTPSMAAAEELLDALQRCAVATHRDTPCVPVYCFRIAHSNADLMPPTPTTFRQHSQLQAAVKRLQVGTPRAAVVADLLRRHLDPALLDRRPDSPLPDALQQRPVPVECTELYLDERAFMQHCGSRDYLDAYGLVVQPRLMDKQPTTLRFGNPPAKLCEQVLDSMLKAEEVKVPEPGFVWRTPMAAAEDSTALLLSCDFTAHASAAAVLSGLEAEWLDQCSACVSFVHPLREDGTIRLLCVLATLPRSGFRTLAALKPIRGEVHARALHGGDAGEQGVRAELDAAGLSHISVNATRCVGHILHQKAGQLQAL